MTKSKRIRLAALFSSVALGGASACYRVRLARTGTVLEYGGVGFEPGLFYVAMAVCVAVFAVMAMLFSAQKDGPTQPAGFAVKLLTALAGLGLVGAAAFCWPDAAHGGAIEQINAVFMGASGLALLLRAALGERSAASGLMSLFPVYYLCFFLLRLYRANGSNPSVQSFCVEILAAVAATLAVYTISALKFERVRERRRMFLCLCAVYFIAVEAASVALMPSLVLSVYGMSPASLAMLVSVGLYVFAGAFYPPSQSVKVQMHAESAAAAGGEEPPLTARDISVDELSAHASVEPPESAENTPPEGAE